MFPMIWGSTAAMAWFPDSKWDATNTILTSLPSGGAVFLPLACATLRGSNLLAPVSLDCPPKNSDPNNFSLFKELRRTQANFVFRRERARPLKND